MNLTLINDFFQTFIAEFMIKMVDAEEVCVSELGLVATATRLQILDWIGRCNASATSSFQTPEGVEIQLRQPLNQQRTTLLSEDGKLELLNYRFVFAVINEIAWNELLKWLDS